MTLDDLYGIWNLISLYAENDKGERDYYFGEDAIGRLTYTPQGYMSAFLMRPERTPLSGGFAEGTPDEIMAAFKEFHGYSGTFSVDLEAGVVTHHVDLALLPNYVGSDQVRYISIEDGILSIYTPPRLMRGEQWVFYINWEKLA